VSDGHKRVIYSCPQCGQSCETQKRYYREGGLCRPCAARQQIEHNRNSTSQAMLIEHNRRSKEMGLSPKGLALVPNARKRYRDADKERTRRQNREATQRSRQTLLGKMKNRLRVALCKYAQGKGGFSQLPYTPAELQAHILSKLEDRQYRCPLCSASLKERFDIDHRIPLVSAKTVDEVIALFALSNLDVLCPPCNQHKKRAKSIEY